MGKQDYVRRQGRLEGSENGACERPEFSLQEASPGSKCWPWLLLLWVSPHPHPSRLHILQGTSRAIAAIRPRQDSYLAARIGTWEGTREVASPNSVLFQGKVRLAGACRVCSHWSPCNVPTCQGTEPACWLALHVAED